MKKQKTDDDLAEIVRLRDRGESWRYISRSMQLSQSAVRRAYDSARRLNEFADRNEPVRILIYGIEARSHGFSGYAWVKAGSRAKFIKETPGLRKIEAEWLALLNAVRSVARGMSVEIITDSLLLIAQLEDRVPVSSERKLLSIVARVFNMIHDQDLKVIAAWGPINQNAAAKKLRATLAKTRRLHRE